MTLPGLDQQMDMVGHEHPAQQPVPGPIEEEQGVLHQAGNLRAPEPTSTVTGVEEALDAAQALGVVLFGLCVEADQGLAGEGVAQVEGDELVQARDIQVGEVTAGVPAWGGLGHSDPLGGWD
jgi:hypothetical protein